MVGRASVQWGGRPRPPTEMAARDGRSTNTSYFSSFVVSAKKDRWYIHPWARQWRSGPAWWLSGVFQGPQGLKDQGFAGRVRVGLLFQDIFEDPVQAAIALQLLHQVPGNPLLEDLQELLANPGLPVQPESPLLWGTPRLGAFL